MEVGRRKIAEPELMGGVDATIEGISVDHFHTQLFAALRNAHVIEMTPRMKPTKQVRALATAAISGFESAYQIRPSLLEALFRGARLVGFEARGAGKVWTPAKAVAA